ncbi:phosphotransferase System HPr (HPr) Family [Clostridium sp. CAG:632]|jgi:phosphotransferase system HPr (HPr) family protein|nr:HPr family phosphocarrier protein [Clostridium sp.]CCY58425.1 phosphotransferase System HPr (HPr) Family [Clostridium sp. CAG:632]
MITRKMVVNIKEDSEGKLPVAMFVQVASRFDSKIYLELEDKKINAKSIMGMMSLPFYANEELLVSCEGADEAEAIETIEEFLQS